MFFSLTDDQMEIMLVASLLPVVQTTGGCRALGIRRFKSLSYHTSANHHPLFNQRGGAAGIRMYRYTLDTEQETNTYAQVGSTWDRTGDICTGREYRRLETHKYAQLASTGDRIGERSRTGKILLVNLLDKLTLKQSSMSPGWFIVFFAFVKMKKKS